MHEPTVEASRKYGVGRVFRRGGSPFWWIAYYVDGEERRESTRTHSRLAAEEFLEARRRDPHVEMFPPGSPEAEMIDRALAWPVELKTLVRLAGSKRLESNLHSIFAAHRRRGDWFDFNAVFEGFVWRAQKEALAQHDAQMRKAVALMTAGR